MDSLSSHTSVADLADVEVGRLAVSTRGIRVTGTATVGVDLGWGGSREGVEMTASCPMRFDVELDRSRTSVSEVHDLTVDTSSFYA